MDKRQKEQAAAKEAEIEMKGRTNESFTPAPAAGSASGVSTDNQKPESASNNRLKSASTVVTVSDIKPDSLAEDSQWLTKTIPWLQNHQSPSNKNSVFKKCQNMTSVLYIQLKSYQYGIVPIVWD